MISRLSVLDLPVGELMRAGLPVFDDAQPLLVVLRQRQQRGVRPGEVGGTAVGQGEHHAGQQGAGCQLPAAGGGRQQGLDRLAGAGAGDDALDGGQREAHRVTGPGRSAG